MLDFISLIHLCSFAYSTADLPLISSSNPFFFANKFYMNEAQVFIGCLEEVLYNRTRDWTQDRYRFDASVYEDTFNVRNRLRPEEIRLKFHPDRLGTGKDERLKNRGMKPY